MAQPATAPEHWTELIAARKQRRLCSEQIEEFRPSCASGCGKKHVSDCTGCYIRVLERMRQRYSGSQDREWFTYRKAFHQELEELFADAKDRKIGLKKIEARIESEKEAWYRWILRKHPEFLVVCDDPFIQDELRGMLDDPDRSRDEVVSMIWRGIGKPPDWAERVDSFVASVEAAEGNAAALRKLYVEEFFMNREAGEPVQDSKPYLDEFSSNEDMSIEGIIGKMVKDAQENKTMRPQQEFFQARLDDLRRARMADELNKKQQAKSQAQTAPDQVAGDELYDLPPCSTCGKVVAANDVFSCTVCQTITQMGGSQNLTVYCSEECFDAGHGKHVDETHKCDGGDSCIQKRRTGKEEDVIMDDAFALEVFVCKQCVNSGRLTLFCSQRCASENMAKHRLAAHEIKTEAADVPNFVTLLSNVVESVLHRENPGLRMEFL
ncbi:hypothetical protein ACHAO4_006476 [Trichoderma viride]